MKCFIDTNVVVYSNDDTDPVKQDTAIELIGDLAQRDEGVVSTQVLQEYAAHALARLGQPEEAVLLQLLHLERLEVIDMTPHLARRAVEIRARYRINYWDACLIAAAESARCARIYTEDLNPGQLYCGIEVVDPFAA